MRPLLALLLALALAAPAQAQLPAALGPDARVFTLAGGDEPPRENLPAHRADLTGSEAVSPAVLPGGDIAVVGGRRGRPMLIGLDGRIHLLPALGGVTALAAAGDGALYAVRHDEDVRRLAPGAAAWTAVPGASGEEVDALAGLPGGGVALAYDDGIHVLDAAGAESRRLPLPDGDVTALASLPDGSLAAAADGFTRAALYRWSAAGEPRRLGPARYGSDSLAAIGDGTLLHVDDDLRAIAPSGRRLARIRPRDGLGLGDGAAPAASELAAAQVAAGADGSVVVAGPALRPAWDLTSFAVRQGAARPVPTVIDLPPATTLRVLAPPGSARPLAALAPATFGAVRRARVHVEATVAGRATVVVRSRGREVARGAADVPAGASTVALDRAPPRGDLSIELVLVAANGAVAGARLPVSTLRALRRRDAEAVARRLRGSALGELDGRLAGCRRRDTRTVACRLRLRVIDEEWCWGVRIEQRLDGRRALFTVRRDGRCG